MISTVVSLKSESEVVEADGDGNTPTIQWPQSSAVEINPLARIAGSYANDPNWPEFIQAMEASRRELDETVELA